MRRDDGRRFSTEVSRRITCRAARCHGASKHLGLRCIEPALLISRLQSEKLRLAVAHDQKGMTTRCRNLDLPRIMQLSQSDLWKGSGRLSQRDASQALDLSHGRLIAGDQQWPWPLGASKPYWPKCPARSICVSLKRPTFDISSRPRRDCTAWAHGPECSRHPGGGIGRRPAGLLFSGDRRFQIVVRAANSDRSDADAIGIIPVSEAVTVPAES
jgi:hypothetical protein